MKDLKQIVEEFKEKVCVSTSFNGNNKFSFIKYESLSGYSSDDKYFDVYFTENNNNKIVIEIAQNTKCVDYVLNIIKQIEPKAVVTSYKKTVTYTEIIN